MKFFVTRIIDIDFSPLTQNCIRLFSYFTFCGDILYLDQILNCLARKQQS
jgi:hypothetical protein